MNENNSTLTRTLYTETRDLHNKVERHPFQQALLRGQLPLERYVDFLREMVHIHSAVDGAHATLSNGLEHLNPVLEEYRSHLPFLEEDLKYYGAKLSPSADQNQPGSTASADFINRLAKTTESEPASLIGFLYVLEGSRNGGRVIARIVRTTYQLPPDQGTSFLDPHGEDQLAFWQRFKEKLDGIALTDAQKAAVVQGARDAFLGMIEVSESLYSAGNVNQA